MKTAWVAPGRGATVRELRAWLSSGTERQHLETRTALMITDPDGTPGDYDRLRAEEALNRILKGDV
jgi:hypothetical protein